MKLIFTALIVTGLATSAFAGTSDLGKDRYVGASLVDVTDAKLGTDQTQTNLPVTFSTRNKKSKNTGSAGEGFIYGGYGPNNDSR